MTPQCHRHIHAAKEECRRTGCRRADDPQPSAIQGDAVPVSCGIDQQQIQNHIDDVDPQIHPHGGFGISGRAQQRAEYDHRRPRQHRRVQDEEIPGCQVLNFRVHLHPHRDLPAEAQSQHRE